MNVFSLAQYLLFVLIVTFSVKPLGGYMDRVFSRRRTVLDPFWVPLERWIYRITGVDSGMEMNAGQYASSFIVFGLICTLFLYAFLRFQHFLPWFYPQYHTTPLTPDLAMNTAISFSTTTTWQAYAGEATMSYFSQLGLAAQNFLAGGAGLAGCGPGSGYCCRSRSQVHCCWSGRACRSTSMTTRRPQPWKAAGRSSPRG